MQQYIVSLVAGILFPLLPLVLEFGFTNDIKPETLTVTAVVYAAAIGLASRNPAIVVSSLFCSAMCVGIYGADESGLRAIRPDIFFSNMALS